MKGKIINEPHYQLCFYCGERIPPKWHEYDPYYECDCPDAKKRREIEKKISELTRQIPNYKFEIIKEDVLYVKTEVK